MARVLITGAAGFIGSQIAHDFVLAGDEVTLVDDFSFGFEDNLVFDDMDLRNLVQRIDIRDQTAMRDLFESRREANDAGAFDFIYHNAAVTPLPECQAHLWTSLSINVAATGQLLELARYYGTKRFFFASTSAVYENETSFPCKETANVSPTLVYASSKLSAERLCRSFSECYGLPATVFRYANVYGPRMDCLRKQPPVVAYLIRELYYGKQPILHGDGEQSRDFIFCDDLSDLVFRCREGGGTFDVVNVSSGTSVSISQIYDTIAKLMGCKHVRPKYEATSHFWSGYPMLFEGQNKIAIEVVENEVTKHTCCDNSHAKLVYGWEPHTSLEQGLQKCVTFIEEKLRLRGIASL